MKTSRLQRILWAGHRSVSEVRELLESAGHAEIQFAPEYHHAIFRRFHSGSSRAEQLDVSGGPELICRVASVRGLDELAELEPLARELHAHVAVVSPVPLLRITREGLR